MARLGARLLTVGFARYLLFFLRSYNHTRYASFGAPLASQETQLCPDNSGKDWRPTPVPGRGCVRRIGQRPRDPDRRAEPFSEEER